VGLTVLLVTAVVNGFLSASHSFISLLVFIYCLFYLHFFYCGFFPDLSQRVDSVKEENLKLKSENQVLGQYIENLMAASSVFQSTSPKAKKK